MSFEDFLFLQRAHLSQEFAWAAREIYRLLYGKDLFEVWDSLP